MKKGNTGQATAAKVNGFFGIGVINALLIIFARYGQLQWLMARIILNTRNNGFMIKMTCLHALAFLKKNRVGLKE